MKIQELITVNKIQKLGKRVGTFFSNNQDIAQLSPYNRVIPAKNRRECIEFAQIYIDGTSIMSGMRIKFLDNLCAGMMGISTSPKSLKIIRNNNGKVAGGYMSSIMNNGETFHIASMGVANPKKSSKTLIKMYADIKNVVQANNIKNVTCIVDSRAKDLIDLYKKIGFSVDGIVEPFSQNFNSPKVNYHMSISAEDFCKIM